MQASIVVRAGIVLLVGCSSSKAGGTLGNGEPDASAHEAGKPTGIQSSIEIKVTDPGRASSTEFVGNWDDKTLAGVRCEYSVLNAKGAFIIDGNIPEVGAMQSALLKYWDFDETVFERDETFPPPPPAVETFHLAITGNDSDAGYFEYAAPPDWSTHAADKAACHTTFSRFDTRAGGKMNCVNLFNERNQMLSTVMFQFDCSLTRL